jgi:hypothetical protein
VERWDLLSFNSLAKAKYERMDWDWVCKDTELLTKEQMDHFLEIAKSTCVVNVQWSGLTKRSQVKED